jgi:membrane-bound lytic murein transglycosylase D
MDFFDEFGLLGGCGTVRVAQIIGCEEAHLTRMRRYGMLLWILAVCLLMMCGCGSRKAFVKNDKDIGTAKLHASSRGKNKARVSLPNKFPAIPVDKDSSRVRKFLREYTHSQRRTMKHYMARAEKYLPMVKAVARENGLPAEIAYLFMLESGADPGARSPANALGMWQFMPATARSYGLRVDSWVDERLDPKKSTQAAMLYLKDLYGMFGCWRLALSAYNSGENKLNRVLCQEDADEYDQICSSKRLKRETREFWPRFQAIAQIAFNPRKYGFSPITENTDVRPYETVAVKGCYSMATLAAAAGTSVDRLARLNPSLIRGMTPPNGSGFSLKVPSGREAVLISRLTRIPQEIPGGHIVHVVHKGDSLWRILRRYNVSKAKLAKLNPDVNFRHSLRQGSRIVVPSRKKVRRKPPQKGKQVSWLR